MQSSTTVKEKMLKNYIKMKQLAAIMLIALMILLLSGFLSRFLLWGGQKILHLTLNSWRLNFWQSIFLGVLSLLWMHWGEKRSFKEMGFRRIDGKMLLQSVFNGLLLTICLLFLTSLMSMIIPEKITAQPLVSLAAEAASGREIGQIYLLSSLAAPISEEIFFRGLLYGGLRAQMSGKKAMVLTSLCFALLHFDLYRLPLLWGAGIWLNILRHRQSLVSSMLAHSVWNALMISLVFIF